MLFCFHIINSNKSSFKWYLTEYERLSYQGCTGPASPANKANMAQGLKIGLCKTLTQEMKKIIEL